MQLMATEARIGSKLEKTERQVSVFVLTGFFEDFLLSFTQLMSNLTLAEKMKTKNPQKIQSAQRLILVAQFFLISNLF